MSIRKHRRAVMAELLLLADPTQIRVFRDGTALSIEFDTIAELRSWLHVAGLNSPDLLTGERDDIDDDGRPYRSMNAYPTWHGWEIFASAVEHTGTPPLGTQTADQLAALAVG